MLVDLDMLKNDDVSLGVGRQQLNVRSEFDAMNPGRFPFDYEYLIIY